MKKEKKMPDASEFQREEIATYQKPQDMSFGEWLESRVARYETRVLDWDALKYQVVIVI